MSRVLGDLIQEGCVAKIADDLYVGGNSPIEVLNNWRRVLALLQMNNRGLSNTPKLSPMDEGHEQPDSPEVSSRET